MIYTEDFARWTPSAPLPECSWRTPTGLNIVSNGIVYSARYQTEEGRIGTELIIHGQCDIEFIFGQTVDCLLLEVDVTTLSTAVSTAYWLTLRDLDYTEFTPGPGTHGTSWHDVPGPLDRLTLSTLPQCTVHIRQLEWRPAWRH
ncbi:MULTISPECIES: hypothetical protein [unclassified Pseudomonas]|uniref:hypothetical protein n=1 Tax=unclassified Pseudomonas TaxID=196821 RepID=UPI000C8871F7|nr:MULTISPECIES: hypothetical protein [unclassified Pseudomonas]PNA01716.1 hypothetical protein C1X79_04360 [Pseudomonas sp. FW305-42]PNA25667.1 hypothetical protein C1X78_08060 [Pseudomonas sp. MPR-R1B]PNB27190.1 hypothetical protein C1X80_08315 [Pseudomonas sp. DP16D-E2]PNB44576.1 hypothetical protein C1X75_05765 [Pseudomonas sp. FW305-17]PNB64803.1 hypothetical protein C1X77_01040 [Pseudomonas sp. GW531-E2]